MDHQPDNPFAPPRQAVAAAPSSTDPDDWEPLGFWRRVLASIVDSVLQALLLLPLGLLLAAVISHEVLVAVINNLANMVISVVAILWLWHKFGATPGKMLFKARILDEKTLKPPKFGRLVLRYAGYVPSSLALGLGFLWVAWDRKKRGWHDLMAGTVVVRPRR